MAIKYTLCETNATDLPVVAASTYSRGFNIPSGSVDEIIVRFQCTLNAAGDVAADFTNLLSNLRVILNGETVWDFSAGYSDNTNNAPGIMGYLLNSMGRGRSVEVNTGDATRDAFIRIPVGRVLNPGISRMEYSISYAALTGAGGAPTANSIEWWVRYNSQIQNTTTLGAATSQPYTASVQQVVMRIPQNVPGTLAGVLLQNDRANDGDITDVRIVSQSDFAMSVSYWRMLNADLYNGVEYMDPATAAQLSFAQGLDGCIFIPLFNLSMNDDLRLQVTATTARTLTLTPVIVSGVSGKPAPAQVQTQPVPTNVGKAILADSAAQA